MAASTFNINKNRVGINRRVGTTGNVSWCVDVVRQGIRAKRRFHEIKCGGVDAALQAAMAWRDTIIEHLSQMERHPATTPQSGRPPTLRSVLPEPHPSLVSMNDDARVAGMVCLDKQWQGKNHHYHFKCPQGHEWKRTRHDQRKNPSCPVCKRNSLRNSPRTHWSRKPHDDKGRAWALSTEQRWLQEAARARGGECLGTRFPGKGAHYRFRCGSGHEWSALASSVRCGLWCSQCQNEALPSTPQEAHLEAQIHGGRCLSTDFENLTRKSPLRWECAQGHAWEASLAEVRQPGRWCAQCARNKPNVHTHLMTR